MKKTVTMPCLKPGMTEGVLCRQSAAPGDVLAAGDVLFEVETDKVVSEVEADEPMRVCRWLADEGDAVSPGGVLCEVEIGKER